MIFFLDPPNATLKKTVSTEGWFVCFQLAQGTWVYSRQRPGSGKMVKNTEFL